MARTGPSGVIVVNAKTDAISRAVTKIEMLEWNHLGVYDWEAAQRRQSLHAAVLPEVRRRKIPVKIERARQFFGDHLRIADILLDFLKEQDIDLKPLEELSRVAENLFKVAFSWPCSSWPRSAIGHPRWVTESIPEKRQHRDSMEWKARDPLLVTQCEKRCEFRGKSPWLNLSLRVSKDRPQCLIDLGVSKNKAESLSFGWYRALTGQQEWGGHFSKCKTKCECRRRHEGRPVHRPT